MSHELIKYSKSLRKKSTLTERLLWKRLRGRQIAGFKFRRQQPIGPFIVDFVNFEKKLIIELDGGQHAKQKNMDRKRDRWLNSQGYSVYRFWNNDVYANIEGVLRTILEGLLSPSPQSPPTRGGEDNVESD